MQLNNVSVARKLFDQGYLPIPISPGDKSKGLPTAWQGDNCPYTLEVFNRIWRGRPLDSNLGIVCHDVVTIVDFDTHADPGKVPSIEVCKILAQEQPELFDGAILEKTAKGGVHATYRGSLGQKFKAIYELDGKVSEVEVLKGDRYAVIPSSRTENGDYVYASDETHLNRRPEQLPELPEEFTSRKAEEPMKKPAKPRAGLVGKDIDQADMQASIDYYINKSYGSGSRHDDARVLARCLVNIGVGTHEAERLVEQYITGHGRELTDPHEAERLVEYAERKAGDPCWPWRAIMKNRQERALKALKGTS